MIVSPRTYDAKDAVLVSSMPGMLTVTVPELELLAATSSKELVETDALFVKTCGFEVVTVTRTGTLMLTSPPGDTVPRLQITDVPPAAPVQAVLVTVPA